jgi:hypothetical protein
VLLEARYALNGAAILRRRHWHERIHGHCTRMLGALGPQIAAAQRALESGAPAHAAARTGERVLTRTARRN